VGCPGEVGSHLFVTFFCMVKRVPPPSSPPGASRVCSEAPSFGDAPAPRRLRDEHLHRVGHLHQLRRRGHPAARAQSLPSVALLLINVDPDCPYLPVICRSTPGHGMAGMLDCNGRRPAGHTGPLATGHRGEGVAWDGRLGGGAGPPGPVGSGGRGVGSSLVGSQGGGGRRRMSLRGSSTLE